MHKRPFVPTPGVITHSHILRSTEQNRTPIRVTSGALGTWDVDRGASLASADLLEVTHLTSELRCTLYEHVSCDRGVFSRPDGPVAAHITSSSAILLLPAVRLSGLWPLGLTWPQAARASSSCICLQPYDPIVKKKKSCWWAAYRRAWHTDHLRPCNGTYPNSVNSKPNPCILCSPRLPDTSSSYCHPNTHSFIVTTTRACAVNHAWTQ